jgi:peptidoglycan/LPS O-acetylase OafA/YrhL
MRIEQLTGLRGVAAVCVLLGHLPHTASEGVIGEAFAAVATKLALPNLGVVVFYSLSSFLLTNLALQEQEATGTVSIRNFLLRRIIRIWPLYFASVVAAAIIYSNTGWLAAEAGYIFSFLSNWSLAIVGFSGHVAHQPSPITLLWSISVEEQFYLLFPILIFALASPSKPYLKLVIGTLVVGGYVFRIAFSILFAGTTPSPGSGGIYFTTFAYLDTFAAGSAAAIVYFHRSNNRFCERICAVLAKASPAVVIALIVLSNFWAGHVWAPYNAATVFSFGLVGVGAATLVLTVAVAEQSLLARLLKSPPIFFLGTISFSFYVWHLYAAGLSMPISSNFPLRLVITFFLAVLMATTSYFVIERPALKLKDRIKNAGRLRTAQRAQSRTA